MGAASIRHRLKRDGYEIGARRVKRLMNEMGLIPWSCREPTYTYNPSSFGRKNKLKRKFDQKELNKVWASDLPIFSSTGSSIICVWYLTYFPERSWLTI